MLSSSSVVNDLYALLIIIEEKGCKAGRELSTYPLRTVPKIRWPQVQGLGHGY